MNQLKKKIVEFIRIQGSLNVSQYMTLVLSDPEWGYYKTANPFGRAGDFITAPEVSQLFGEMIATFAMISWQELNKPPYFVLAEMGPGRGTLMADVLRVIHKAMPDMAKAATIVMLESSPRLTCVQQDTLAIYENKITWYEQFSQLPKGPMIFIANELFDALPIHQFVLENGRLRERIITLDKDDELIFTLAPSGPRFNHTDLGSLPNGTIIELSPAREGLMDEIANRLNKESGRALLIDYGSLEPAFGDTLQALSKHKMSDIFESPGEHDLTSHVDFAALRKVAKIKDCTTQAMSQGHFLIALGLLERAGKLGSGKSHEIQDKIRDDVERLASPTKMGDLFKILIVTDKTHPSVFF